MIFEWDRNKAAANERKHGVSFQEAATVFGDTLALTFDDPDHSLAERRFITVGMSRARRILIIAHVDRGETVRIISPARQRRRSGVNMKKKAEKRHNDELRREYNLAAMGPGVRGKHAKAYSEGTNLVLLSPDVAAHFPDDQAVDAALRTFIQLAKRRHHRGKR